MLGNLSKRSHNLLIHLRIVINYFLSVRGVEPAGLPLPRCGVLLISGSLEALSDSAYTGLEPIPPRVSQGVLSTLHQ